MKLLAALLLLATLIPAPARAVNLRDRTPGQVELLIAAPSTNSFESMFGHAALLIVPEGGTWKQGLVIDFAANFGPEKVSSSAYYVKGLTGGVPLGVGSQYAETYFYMRLVEEARDVERLVLPMTREQKKKLWNEILDLQANPEKLGSYVFHLKNCASALLKLLQTAGVSINYRQIYGRSTASGVSPMQLISQIRTALSAPYPPQKVASIATQARAVEKRHGVQLRSEYDEKTGVFSPWTNDDLAKLERMSLEELILASQLISALDGPRSTVMQTLIRKTGRRIQTRFVQLDPWPRSFYDVCENEACFAKLTTDLRAFYEPAKLRKLWVLNKQEQERTAQLFVPELDLERGTQPVFWKSLTDRLAPSMRR